MASIVTNGGRFHGAKVRHLKSRCTYIGIASQRYRRNPTTPIMIRCLNQYLKAVYLTESVVAFFRELRMK